jgi:hypothetical protein
LFLFSFPTAGSGIPANLALSEIQLGEKLGGGQFGLVFKGTWQGKRKTNVHTQTHT